VGKPPTTTKEAIKKQQSGIYFRASQRKNNELISQRGRGIWKAYSNNEDEGEGG